MATSSKVTAALRGVVRRAGFDVVRYRGDRPPSDFDAAAAATALAVRPYTMTTDERIGALIEAVRYAVRAGIPGAVVECGVWRGGSSLAAARTLVELGDTERDLYLFDTFEGMPAPTALDRTNEGEDARTQFEKYRTSDASSSWCYASLDEVRSTMALSRYPSDRIHYVQGKVEDTIPEGAPAEIALLRLDTDWYESTRHELLHLFPRVAPGGVVVLDDYGHWDGARKAVDEYLEEHQLAVLLTRVDYSGRVFVVPNAPVRPG